MNTQIMGIGEIIAYFRNLIHMSQTTLADGICTKEYIYKIEKGKCSPTITMLDQLSSKLNINLYDQYATIYRQGGIENHKRIVKLNEYFIREKLEQLPVIFNECENLTYKMEGELYQFYLYGKALYSSHISNDLEGSLNFELDGIKVAYPNYTSKLDLTSLELSNISLTLIQSLGVDLSRTSRKKEGYQYLIQLHRYLDSLMKNNDYVINRNHHFETKLGCSIIHNLITFNTDYYTDQELYQLCGKGLDFLKHYNLSFVLPELLFDQCKICQNLKKELESKKLYLMAQMMGDFYYNVDTRKDLERSILGDQLILDIEAPS